MPRNTCQRLKQTEICPCPGVERCQPSTLSHQWSGPTIYLELGKAFTITKLGFPRRQNVLSNLLHMPTCSGSKPQILAFRKLLDLPKRLGTNILESNWCTI